MQLSRLNSNFIPIILHHQGIVVKQIYQKVQVGKDQEKVQSEKDSHSKHRGGKNKLTIRYLYHEKIS